LVIQNLFLQSTKKVAIRGGIATKTNNYEKLAEFLNPGVWDIRDKKFTLVIQLQIYISYQHPKVK